jgi:hypothetical protein
LRPRRYRADFDEPEAKLEERIGYFGMLIEPCCHPYRIGKVEPAGSHCQPWVVAGLPREYRKFQGTNGYPVRILLIEDA